MTIIRTLLYICLIAAAMAMFQSCGAGEDKPVPPAGTKTTRTVLVYMVAANNLGRPTSVDGVKYRAADSLDLDEMQLAASRGDLGTGRWLVFHATYDSSRLMELTRDGFKTLRVYEHTAATDAARMAEVIDDVRKTAPAESYGMVFWSHANGWLEDGTVEESTEGVVPLSFGIHKTKRMNITTMRRVLTGRGMEYLYFDCCLMGSVEVAYELRDCADYIVSSPSELPRDGMRYDLNMKYLVDGSREALVHSALNTFNHYNSLDESEMRTATMSVVSTAGLDRLAAATAVIYAVTPPNHPLKRVTNYYGSDRVSQGNYLDFAEYVRALVDANGADVALVEEFDRALEATVVWSRATEKLWDLWPMYNASGLSTRVFTRAKDFDGQANYGRLQWASDVVAPRFIINE